MIKAKYTVVLKTIMDDPEGRKKLDQALSTYPLYIKKSPEEFIPAYIPTRQELNEKILRYYKYREIGFETVGRFLDELETAMLEIMPKYNLLFLTADQDFNIIWNVDYKRTIDRNQQGSNEANTSGTDTQDTSTTATDSTTTGNNVESSSKQVKTQTPQDKLSIPAEAIDTVDYADEANWGKDKSNASGTSSSNGSSTAKGTTTRNDTIKGSNTEKETTLETTKGNFGVVSSQDLVLKFRETIRNIEQEIINDPRIAELFMLLY